MASRTSLVGAVGVGNQSAKDVVSTNIIYVPTTSIGINQQQNVQTLPPEVGGSYFLRGSYKATVMGAGDIGMVVRPNSFTYQLWALTGQDTTTAVSGQSGAYQHVFTPFVPSANAILPWQTLYKDIAKLTAEQYLNAKLSTLSVDVSKSSIVTAQSSYIATTPSMIQVSALPTETFDTTPPFQTCQAVVTLTPEGSDTNISANSVKMERFAFTFNNNLTSDEFSVGSYYLDEVTMLQKTATVDMDVVVRDTALYQAVYANGGSIPSQWSPTVYRGTLTLTLSSTTNIPGTTQPYQLIFNFPGLDFLMMPINLAGAQLVRATLSSQVTLGPSGADTYTLTLINALASGY